LKFLGQNAQESSNVAFGFAASRSIPRSNPALD
jgi:hypothetical protein